MSTLILVVVVGAAGWFQWFSDSRTIASMAEQCRWSISSLRWLPFTRFFSSRRTDRWYRLCFVDDQGRKGMRLCRVRGWLGIGTTVDFDQETLDQPTYGDAPLPSSVRARKRPTSGLGHTAFALLCAFGGAWGGALFGIAGSLLIFHGSNIAPAYGVIFMAPVGFVAGLTFGLLRKSREER